MAANKETRVMNTAKVNSGPLEHVVSLNSKSGPGKGPLSSLNQCLIDISMQHGLCREDILSRNKIFQMIEKFTRPVVQGMILIYYLFSPFSPIHLLDYNLSAGESST